MVGHLHLQAMDESLKGQNREGLLDSPDSGLPPSPSPPFCSLSPALVESAQGQQQAAWKKDAKLLSYLLLDTTGTDARTRMYPVIYGESIEVDPKPEQELKCTSAVRYDSDKHYRDRVYCVPVPTTTAYAETVVVLPNCTWRSYRSQVYLEPRQKPVGYQTTAVVYPKHAKNIYRTTLTYKAAPARRWFVSRVQLESSEDSSPCIIYTEDL
ncbi:LOW QUALITY PROTEIN: refilin-A [Phycodurus eques]|uniref:LOW QUALITY PROTEIN: refilin-A n=1 Tax=Phycodurus eques TaxID=693459 RepID=UPI002ACE57D4|nr:LOW QUALITY PROTEIN: refilin-A [Phycodurus eques]